MGKDSDIKKDSHSERVSDIGSSNKQREETDGMTEKEYQKLLNTPKTPENLRTLIRENEWLIASWSAWSSGQ